MTAIALVIVASRHVTIDTVSARIANAIAQIGIRTSRGALLTGDAKWAEREGVGGMLRRGGLKDAWH